MTWKGRRLKTVNGLEMDYDFNGLRVKKGEKTFYWFNGNLIMERWGENGTKKYIYYYYDESGVCGMNVNGKEYFYLKNILGDILAIYDCCGNLQCRYVYDAWGNHKIYGSNGAELSAVDLNVGNTNPFRYRGYYWDKEFSLYYLKTRYYDPALGRFISADDVSYLNPQTIQGLNLYAYCENNPVMGVDPNGTIVISFLVGLAVSFTIGFASSAISQGVQNGWDNINYLQAGIDGLFATASTALAVTGIGLATSIALGAGMSFTQYAIDSAFHNESLTWEGALISIGVGALGGLISGRGASNWKTLSDGISGRAETGIKALTTTISRYGQNSAQYAKVLNLYGSAIRTSVQNVVNSAFTQSTIRIWASAFIFPFFQQGLNTIGGLF